VIGKEVDEGLIGCDGVSPSRPQQDVPKRGSYVPLSKALISVSLLASSSFLKSFVFCARSFLCTVESRWYATISDAVLSRLETSAVKSRSRPGLELDDETPRNS
jgi:hypothetical protein